MTGKNKAILSSVSLILLLGLLRFYFPERPVDYVGPRALIDALFALGLTVFTILFCYGIGVKVLNFLRLNSPENHLKEISAIAIGSGLLATSIFTLGLIGLFNWKAILCCLAIAGFWGSTEWLKALEHIPKHILLWVKSWKDQPIPIISLWIVLVVLFALTLIQALSPPWDYDGLAYHLQGPKLFLEQGRITPLWENWETFYPSTIEMLFSVGLSFGSEAYPKLINLSFAVLLALATYSLGRKIAGKSTASLSVLILVSIPIFPIWASAGYIDIAWAFFELLNISVLFIWRETRQDKWLVLAGLMAGLAAGTKYLALGGFVVSGCWILFYSWKLGINKTFRWGLIYGTAVLTACFPWYLKNWFWTGNPLYPFFFTTALLPAERMSLWFAYVQNFGAGKGIADYFLLPVTIYTQYLKFGTFMGSIEIPSFVFPVILFYPWVKKNQWTNGLMMFTILRFAAWSLGSQQTRLLISVFPLISILSAYIINQSINWLSVRKWRMMIGKSVLYGICISGVVYSFIYLIEVKPIFVTIGIESKASFLRRNINDYSGVNFIRNELSKSSQVMMLWDGRGYYCDSRCLPDIDHTQWTWLTLTARYPEEVTTALRKQGITHLFLSLEDANFILSHDPTQYNMEAMKFFNQYIQQCGNQIYQDQWVRIYQLTCG
jgi:4-amino-4-deoxy-L-arabinose transferase-like glycosyltransferase